MIRVCFKTVETPLDVPSAVRELGNLFVEVVPRSGELVAIRDHYYTREAHVYAVARVSHDLTLSGERPRIEVGLVHDQQCPCRCDGDRR